MHYYIIFLLATPALHSFNIMLFEYVCIYNLQCMNIIFIITSESICVERKKSRMAYFEIY